MKGLIVVVFTVFLALTVSTSFATDQCAEDQNLSGNFYELEWMDGGVRVNVSISPDQIAKHKVSPADLQMFVALEKLGADNQWKTIHDDENKHKVETTPKGSLSATFEVKFPGSPSSDYRIDAWGEIGGNHLWINQRDENCFSNTDGMKYRAYVNVSMKYFGTVPRMEIAQN